MNPAPVPHKIFIKEGEQRWPFSKGLIVETLVNAGLSIEMSVALARSVEQLLFEQNLWLITSQEVQALLIQLVEKQAGSELAGHVASQTPIFEDIKVTRDNGDVIPFSRGILSRSLEDIGLSARDAHRVANRVNQLLRGRGVRQIDTSEIETTAETALAELLGDDWDQTYRFLRHNRGRLGVLDTSGLAVPFSKGILSQSLLAAGLSPKFARRIARETQQRLRGREGRILITHDALANTVEEILRRELGDAVATRYQLLRTIRRPPKPIVVLLGGVTGTGKSVLAAEVAYRLGITRIVSTDSVRQVMRATLSSALLPTLHVSTFNAWEVLLEPGETKPSRPSSEQLVAGFRDQIAQVSVGLGAIINRSIEEKTSLMIEGVHAAPGYLMATAFQGALVIPILVTVPAEEEHRRHFEARGQEAGPLRPAGRYLEHFREIRILHDYLYELALRTDVPTLEAHSFDEAAQQAVEFVVQRVTRELELE